MHRIASIAIITANLVIGLGLGQELFAQTRPGFYVEGRHLHDPCGQKVTLIGANAMIVYWDRDGAKTYPELAKTGANVCRIMWHWDYPTPTAAEFDKTIQNCMNNKMLPMPGMWAATGKWSEFQKCVDYWASDSIVKVVKKHEKYLLVNIANEPGSGKIPDAEFRGYFEPAIKKLRAAGIHTPIVVDATQYGRDENSVINNGPYLVQQDPDHNLIFGWHLYDPITWTGTRERIKSAIDRAVAADICFIVGEFGFSESPGDASKDIDWRYLIQYCTEKDVGWLPWCWKGDALSMTPDYTFANLNAWGREVAVTSPYSIQNTAKRTPFFSTLTCSGVSAKLTTDETSGAMPLTVSFDASGSTGSGLAFAWKFGDGATGSGTKASHTYTAAGTYRAVVTVTAGTDKDSAAVTITVVDPSKQPVLISGGRTAVASSEENSQFGGHNPASNVTDGNLSTRWSSTPGLDNQWIYVDMGQRQSFGQVILRWEAAYGKSYKVQVSDDAQTWTDVFSKTNGNGGNDTVLVNTSGRYVRMLGLTRGTNYGFSLYEFEIYQMPDLPTGIAVKSRMPGSRVPSLRMTADTRVFDCRGVLLRGAPAAGGVHIRTRPDGHLDRTVSVTGRSPAAGDGFARGLNTARSGDAE